MFRVLDGATCDHPTSKRFPEHFLYIVYFVHVAFFFEVKAEGGEGEEKASLSARYMTTRFIFGGRREARPMRRSSAEEMG